jgi:predicted Zn-dependent protease
VISEKQIKDFVAKLKNAVEVSSKKYALAEIEFSLIASSRITYRLSRNLIIQPQAEVDTRLSVRVVNDKRTGVAVINSTEIEEILGAVDKAYSLSLFAEPKNEAGLPEKAHQHHEIRNSETEKLFDHRKNFERIQDMLLLVKDARALLSGKLEVSYNLYVVISSAGSECIYSHPAVRADFIVEKDELSGYSSFISETYEPFVVQLELENAISKCGHYGERIELSPGLYDVLLEPHAAAEFVELFAIYGFSAKLLQEGRSYLTGRLGEKLFSPLITLADNPYEDEQIKMPFDFEGVRKQKVELIKNGIASSAVYDTETARIEGVRSTGHSLPLPNPHGPAPLHLCLEGGAASYEQIIEKIERGILITRLNYTNIEDEKNGIITGMTRDGTFLIENGEITTPVYDLRFTQSVPEALKNVVSLSRERKLVSPFFGYSLFPWMFISDFKITGSKRTR